MFECFKISYWHFKTNQFDVLILFLNVFKSHIDVLNSTPSTYGLFFFPTTSSEDPAWDD